MLKFLFRAIFKPKYRPKTRPTKNSVSETLVYIAEQRVTNSPKPLSKPNFQSTDTNKTFDAATAHSVKPHLVLEGPAYVIDGDTITVQKTQVRLFGIDAPELHHPFGKKAKWAMIRLCKGHRIRAEITEEDEYGRTVAKCSLPDGRDLSAEMVKQGLAIDWPKFSGGKYSHMEVEGIRKKLWLADARQKGRMHVWERFEARKSAEDREK